MADDVLKAFVVQLGWKIDKDGERKVNEALIGITRSATVLVGALAAAAAAAATAAAKIAASFDQLYFVSQRTSASAKNIQSLSYAFDQVGSSGGNAVNAIESFARSMRTNPGVASFVKSLGVATTAGGRARDSIDVLSDAIEKIQQRPYYVGAQYAELLGIDEATYDTLVRYSKEIKEFRAEYERTARIIGLNNEEATKVSNKFWTTLRSLQATVTAVAQKLAIDLVPALTAFVDKIRAWIEANPDKIRDGILAISAAVTGLAAGFTDVVEVLTPVLKGFQGMAELLTGKEGLQASFEAFAVFLMTIWLAKVLGAFTAVGNGWAAMLLRLGIPVAAGAALGTVASGGGHMTPEQYKANPDSAELDRQGIERRGKVRDWWGRNMPRILGGDPGDMSDGKASKTRGGNAAGARESYDFWRSKGLTHAQAAGLVGMEEGESQFDPGARGDGGLAHGAFQHHPDRRRAILRGTGIDMSNSTHRQQLEGAYWELTQGGERGAWEAIKRAKTAGEAAAAGVYLYERPADKRGEAMRRGQRANYWAGHIRDQSAAAPAVPPLNFPQAGRGVGSFDANGVLRAPPIGAGITNNTSSRSLTNSPNYNVTIHTTGDAQATANAFTRSARDLNSEALRDIQALNR